MKTFHSRSLGWAPIMLITTGLVGCATTPIPADRLARSQAAVKTAEEMNAGADPRARLHLQLAKQQLHDAKQLMVDGKNADAKLVLDRAEADGEAAYNIARARAAQTEARKTIENIQQAMTQMQQKGSGS